MLEVVGLSAALRLAFTLLRPMGVLSSVGVHTSGQFPFTPVEGYDKNLTYKTGRCPARHMMDRLLDMTSAKQADFSRIITHRLPLTDGVRGYQIFDQKLENCVKPILYPWGLPQTPQE